MVKTFIHALILLVLLAGCSNHKENPDKGKAPNKTNNKDNSLVEYFSKDSSYSISFPEDWQVKKGRQSFQLMALTPLADSSDKFREDIIVFREKFPKDVKDLDGYIDYTKKKISKLLKDYKEGKSGKAKINGLKGRWFEYSFTLNKNIKNKCLAYVYDKDKNAYVVLASALDTTYDSFKPLFERIDSTFILNRKYQLRQSKR